MPLHAFSFPFPETRFFKAGSFIYKFKIRGGSSFRGEEVMRENSFNQELEDILRTVLGNLDSLQPFSSAHFNVFPYKKPWEGWSKVMCKHGEGRLRAYPFNLILYLEKNTPNEGAKQAAQKLSPQKDVAQRLPSVSEPQIKRRRRDSPLEEAILKDLHGNMEAESKVSVVGLSLHRPHAQREVQEDRGHGDQKFPKGFDKPQQKSGVNPVRGSGDPGEVDSGSIQHMGEEERDEGTDSVPGTPVRPGMLRRLASHIFPFSLLFRDPLRFRGGETGGVTASSSGNSLGLVWLKFCSANKKA